MNSFFELPSEQRRNAIAITANNLGVTPFSVEKDLLVCEALKVLFSMSDAKSHLTFKGGTSLSKGFGLIQRFSEDLDIVVSRELIGVEREPPDIFTGSKKSRTNYVKHIQKSLSTWVEDVAMPVFAESGQLTNDTRLWSCRLEGQGQHLDTISLDYDSVFEGPGPDYIRPRVKVEFGSRGDKGPSTFCMIYSYIASEFPNSVSDPPIEVAVLAPERTFLEKLCLVHEEISKPGGLMPRPTMSRHFYDLYCLINAGYGERAMGDHALFDRVVHHRELYFNRATIDYSRMHRRSLSLIPDNHKRDLWELDYEQMKESMLFGNPPDFDKVLSVIEAFAKEFLTN